MKASNKKMLWIGAIIIIGLFVVINVAVSADTGLGKRLLNNFKVFEPVKPLLPPDVKIMPKFVEGTEANVGHVQKTQGKVYVIHKDDSVAYRLKKNYSLFSGDTLITSRRARINAVMKDKSVFALAASSKMVIDKSVYDPEKETRTSIFGVLFGRVRFIVKKLTGKSRFTVKTQTAVCGVRGSDFAISVRPATEETSSIDNFFARFSLVRKAHALLPGALITTALTGPGSTVGLTGAIGGTTIVGPASVAGAVTGAAAGGATFVGATVAAGVLGSVGPGLATLSMPPEFD